MSRYRLRFVPQGAIPPDLAMGIHMQRKPDAQPVTQTFDAPCSDGSCLGLSTPDGTLISSAGGNVLRVIPSSPVMPKPCWSEADFTWTVVQTSGATHDCTVTNLGTSWKDGITLSFPGGSSGDYNGAVYFAWVGINFMGQLVLPCGAVGFSGPYGITLSFGFSFTYASWDDTAKIAHYGVEPDISFVARWTLSGTQVGPVVWTDAPTSGDPTYSYTILSSDDTQITIQFDRTAGGDLDIMSFYATDANSVVSPTVYVTQ